MVDLGGLLAGLLGYSSKRRKPKTVEKLILLKNHLFWKIEMNAWGPRKNLRSQMIYRRL